VLDTLEAAKAAAPAVGLPALLKEFLARALEASVLAHKVLMLSPWEVLVPAQRACPLTMMQLLE